MLFEVISSSPLHEDLGFVAHICLICMCKVCESRLHMYARIFFACAFVCVCQNMRGPCHHCEIGHICICMHLYVRAYVHAFACTCMFWMIVSRNIFASIEAGKSKVLDTFLYCSHRWLHRSTGVGTCASRPPLVVDLPRKKILTPVTKFPALSLVK